jgi:hypothetical protein
MQAERTRVMQIKDAAQPFVESGRLTDAEVSKMIADGVSFADASAKMLNMMAARETAPSTARIVRDEVDTRREGMEGALVAQMSGARTVDGPARNYMNHGILAMAAESVGIRRHIRGGEDAYRVLEMALGPHTAGDFPAVFENALNKQLLKAYTAAGQTYREISARMDFTDFRPHPMETIGDMPTLLPLGEGGEIKSGTSADKKETVQLGTYARKLSLTRQMLVNDDLSAINRLMASRGRAIAQFEDVAFYNMFLGGAGNDGPQLTETSRQVFNATDLTKASVAAAITVASLSAGRQAMRGKKGLGGVDADKLFIATQPSILLVGPAKETEAQQMLAPIQAAQSSNVNVFNNGTLRLVVSNLIPGNAWYLFAEPSDVPTFMYGYLAGAEGPRFRMDEPFGVEGIAYSTSLDFGFGAIDYRGGYKNAGA